MDVQVKIRVSMPMNKQVRSCPQFPHALWFSQLYDIDIVTIVDDFVLEKIFHRPCRLSSAISMYSFSKLLPI